MQATLKSKLRYAPVDLLRTICKASMVPSQRYRQQALSKHHRPMREVSLMPLPAAPSSSFQTGIMLSCSLRLRLAKANMLQIWEPAAASTPVTWPPSKAPSMRHAVKLVQTKVDPDPSALGSPMLRLLPRIIPKRRLLPCGRPRIIKASARFLPCAPR